jgi:hypothetical protein
MFGIGLHRFDDVAVLVRRRSAAPPQPISSMAITHTANFCKRTRMIFCAAKTRGNYGMPDRDPSVRRSNPRCGITALANPATPNPIAPVNV